MNLNDKALHKIIVERLPFKVATLSAQYDTPSPYGGGLGVLGEPDVSNFLTDSENCFQKGWGIYVLRSYATPIAWAYEDGNGHVFWRQVNDKFSKTTTRHQNIIREALTTLWSAA